MDSYFLGSLATCTLSVVLINLGVLPLAMDTQTYASNDVSLAQIWKEGGTMDLTLCGKIITQNQDSHRSNNGMASLWSLY